MRSFLKKILILLAFLTFAATAEDSEKIVSCEELNACFEKCAEDDESCMDKCDTTYICPDDHIDTES